jgi:transcriptional regulator with XRE-family HTH domain
MRGDRLRKLREEKDFSQEKLAEYLGIGQQQIWRYENGETKPNTEILAKIAKALDVSADYLLGLTDEPKGYVEVEITPQEKRALEAFRRGDIKAIIRLMPDDKPSEASN